MRSSMSTADRVLRALRREGGKASAAMLGRATGRGHRVNGMLRLLEERGLVERTGEREGKSPIWALVKEE